MEIGVREILEITGTTLMGLLTLVWQNLNGELKAAKAVAAAATPRQEFIEYIERAEIARREFRENMVKLFDKVETHEQRDSEKFQTLAKDFTDGLNSIRETMNENHNEALRELARKADR